MRVRLPNNWQPRPYQRALWDYLEAGGTRAVAVCHRRWGKDEVALHYTATATQLRVGAYWHLLPQAAQARKAIWEAVNPHTGLRRIDEAFPRELRETTLNNEMFIRFLNGSTWQVVGSDNFNSLVGSPPIGLVLSEYALSNPSAWSYLRPILLENGGWALFIYTPRGKNHGHALLKSAEASPGWYHEVAGVSQTQAIPLEALAEEQAEMIRENGLEHGKALFMQEWECSFEAAILGAFYGLDMMRAQEEGRIGSVPFQPPLQTYTAWDLGWRDDTAIWFYQLIRGEVHVIDYEARSGANIAELAALVRSKPYHYGKHFLPHDARAKTLASGGKSIVEQLADHLGVENLQIVPDLSVQDGIQAVRMMMPNCWFDAANCEHGLEALRQYQREYDDDKKAFRQSPRHDWTSHGADAFRYLAVAWKNEPKVVLPQPGRPLIVGPGNQSTLNDAWAAHRVASNRRL